MDIKVIILNNNHLGLVRQQQALFYNKNLSAVKFQQTVDFAATARSMGVNGLDLGQSECPLDDLKQALHASGTWVINLPICETEMVFPMVAPGAANGDMIYGETA